MDITDGDITNLGRNPIRPGKLRATDDDGGLSWWMSDPRQYGKTNDDICYNILPNICIGSQLETVAFLPNLYSLYTYKIASKYRYNVCFKIVGTFIAVTIPYTDFAKFWIWPFLQIFSEFALWLDSIAFYCMVIVLRKRYVDILNMSYIKYVHFPVSFIP